MTARIAPNDRRIQNAFLEFLPSSQPFVVGGKHEILHETYFADLGRRKGAVKVSTIHDVIPLERPELFTKRNVIFSTRNFHRQAKEADCIISVSNYTKQRILDFVPEAEDRIVVIGNGRRPFGGRRAHNCAARSYRSAAGPSFRGSCGQHRAA